MAVLSIAELWMGRDFADYAFRARFTGRVPYSVCFCFPEVSLCDITHVDEFRSRKTRMPTAHRTWRRHRPLVMSLLVVV